MIDKVAYFDRAAVSSELLFSSKEIVSESEDLKYFWTRDPKILKEYTKLIDVRFKESMNIDDAYKKINDTDFKSYFLIGTLKNEIAGGVRASICPAGEDVVLPNELFGFNYKEFFSELNLKENGYVEIDQYAVKAGYRNITDYDFIFRSFKELCDEKHIKYLFIPASRARQKLYKVFASRYFKFIGQKKIDIAQLEGQSDISNADDYWFYAYEI